MAEANTLSGFHIRGRENGTLKLYTRKNYTWHIPKKLRKAHIQPGDIVVVGKNNAPFLVMEVFREELEETGRRYKRVKSILERRPQNDEEKE